MKLYLKILFLMITLGGASSLSGQIEISEISSNGTVELINTSSNTVNVSNYWLCNRPSYTQLSNLMLECGQLNLAPGETVTVSGFGLSANGDELGVYTNSSFGSAASLDDYVIWGNRAGSTREAVAVAAGLWTQGSRAPAIPASQSLNKNTAQSGVAAYSSGLSTICPASGPTTPTGQAGPIEISEISNTGYVELINTSGGTVDISNYYLCNRPSYAQLSTLTVECGQLVLTPGATVTVSGFNLPAAGSELGVYSNSSFGSAAGLSDYVIFGNKMGATREGVAVAAGLWMQGDRAPAIPASQSLNKDIGLSLIHI